MFGVLARRWRSSVPPPIFADFQRVYLETIVFWVNENEWPIYPTGLPSIPAQFHPGNLHSHRSNCPRGRFYPRIGCTLSSSPSPRDSLRGGLTPRPESSRRILLSYRHPMADYGCRHSFTARFLSHDLYGERRSCRFTRYVYFLRLLSYVEERRALDICYIVTRENYCVLEYIWNIPFGVSFIALHRRMDPNDNF